MAVDPLRRQFLVTYDGGSVSGAKGTIEALFGTVTPTWQVKAAGPGKRPYGSRQRSNAAAGEPMTVEFQDGFVATVRVTGTHTRFIQEVLARDEGQIAAIYSERGSWYGPQAPVLEN